MGNIWLQGSITPWLFYCIPKCKPKVKIKINFPKIHIVLDFNCLFTLLFWLKKRYLTISSVASGQSRSPSHLHLLVMQYPFPQAKSFCRSHLFSGHFRSSLPSPQSSSWSHNHFFWMQLPLSQVNSSDVQVWSKKLRLLGSIQKLDHVLQSRTELY